MKQMDRTTLKDIAQIVGVSVSTVSKALRGSMEISAETVDRIRQAAVKLNYNNMAVKNGETRAMGVLLPEITSYVYANLLECLENKLQSYGYDLLLGVHRFDIQKIESFVKLFTTKRLDAILLVENTARFDTDAFESVVEVCNQHQTPLYVIESCYNSNYRYTYHALAIDECAAIHAHVLRLIEYGHEKFGLIFDRLSKARAVHGVMEVLQSHGVDAYAKEHVFMTDLRNERAGKEGMKYFLGRPDCPTAYIASYDEVCIGALEYAYAQGYRSPRDFSIFSFDNTRVSKYVYNGISTIGIPIQKIVKIAVDTVMEEIKHGPDTSKTMTKINCEPVFRRTTGELPTSAGIRSTTKE